MSEHGSEHLDTDAPGGWVAVMFIAVFLCMLVGIAVYPQALGTLALGGFSWGQLLVLALHVLPVLAAWMFVGRDS